MKSIIYIAIATLLAFKANAHNGATGIVKERMDVMSSMGKSTKQLTRLVKNKHGPDYAKISELSKQIALSNASLLKMFPVGSLPDASEAAASIWRNWEDFSELMKQSETAATRLAETAMASAPTPELKQQLKHLTKSCKSCHKKYRRK